MVSNRTVESRSRRFILSFNISATVAVSLASGNFLVGLYAILNVSDALLGILTTVAQLCNIAQILSPLLLDRFPGKKKIVLILRCVYHLFFIVIIGSIPYFPVEDGFKVSLLVASMVVANLAAALAGPGISMLHIRSLPDRLRASFFMIMSMMYNVCTYVFILVCGWIVDYMRDTRSLLTGITVVRAIALVFSVLEIISTINIYEHKEPDADKKADKKFALTLPFKDTKYMMCCALVGAWSFFANIPGLFYSSYLINDVGVPYSFLGTVSILSLPILMVFGPVWSKVINRHSWFKSISMAMVIYATCYLVCAFVDKGNYMFLYPCGVVLSFIGAPCINIVIPNMPYMHLPESGRSGYLGFYAGFNSFMAMLGLLTGTLIINLTSGAQFSFFRQTLINKQFLYLIVWVLLLVLSAAFMLLKKHEKRV